MWALLGRFRCRKCGEVRGISRRALRSPFRSRIGVCRDCLSRWEQTGHRCGQCWSPIQGKWDLGLLLDRGVFAHVECGGAVLVQRRVAAAKSRLHTTLGESVWWQLLPSRWSRRSALPASIPVGDAINSRPLSKGRRPGQEATGKPAATTLSPRE